MNFLDIMIWIPTLTLLGYSIPACYYDLKYRELPVGFWTGLLVVCIPITGALYLTGTYQWYLGALSIGVAMIYFMLERLDIIQGADFMYLLFIALFLVQNPKSGNVLMPVSFGIFLIASVVGCAIIYQTIRHLGEKRGKLVILDMPQKGLPGFPFLIPISLALWLTVMLA